MLAGIFYGSQYGGSTTSILVNIPGEASSVVTCLDGYQMARQGRAGPALGIAAFGSFIAGTVGIVVLMFLSEPLSSVAIQFGPPEYFSLIILSLTVLTYLAQGSMLKAIIMALLGICLSLIGLDMVTGYTRFTFGIIDLEDGIGLIPMVMGLFGIAEILENLENDADSEVFQVKISNLLPTLKDWCDSWAPIVRGTVIGLFLGILPGGGAVVSSFVSYAVEKKVSKRPETFGKGAIEGVAGPESANNAASSGSFIPLFTLGIPSNAVMALLLGALMLHGLQPGPLLLKERPDIFWGVVASMYIGNVLLLVLNLPLIGLWVKLLKVPYRILFPLILFFCFIGSYSINGSIFDLIVMILFGVAGYFFRKFGYEAAPLIMAFILGPKLEYSLRQSLLISQGDFAIFFTRNISLTCLLVALLLISMPLFSRRNREVIAKMR
jgi:putative tricarboxylic transport membrane protein